MSAGFRNTNSFLLFFNAVTLLTLAPLASFPDLAGPMIHGGDFKGFYGVVCGCVDISILRVQVIFLNILY